MESISPQWSERVIRSIIVLTLISLPCGCECVCSRSAEHLIAEGRVLESSSPHLKYSTRKGTKVFSIDSQSDLKNISKSSQVFVYSKDIYFSNWDIAVHCERTYTGRGPEGVRKYSWKSRTLSRFEILGEDKEGLDNLNS